jgi:predicted cobalt transporter CbtA
VVRFIRLVLFIVLVMMPLIVEAQTYETNLTGTVAGPNGAPISNVQVKVVNSRNKCYTNDEDGRFRLVLRWQSADWAV